MRNESGAALPKDGTVAESTSNVLVFLEQLSENAETAGIVLRRNNEVDTISTSSAKQIDNSHRVLVGVYISIKRKFRLIIYHNYFTYQLPNF